METRKGLEALKQDVKTKDDVRSLFQKDPAQVFVDYGLAEKVSDVKVTKLTEGAAASRGPTTNIKCACGCAFTVELEAEN
ncbi:MAG TPA: hypothetical protein VD969_22490 [Symbiobacteriaceae bacterium]|nr:hypothetical protein [Symbiobacteriaceae bacterium]